MPCSPCNNTGKQKDREGKECTCPRCRGTGDAITFENRFFTNKKQEVVNG